MPYVFSGCLDDSCDATVDDLNDGNVLDLLSGATAGPQMPGSGRPSAAPSPWGQRLVASRPSITGTRGVVLSAGALVRRRDPRAPAGYVSPTLTLVSPVQVTLLPAPSAAAVRRAVLVGPAKVSNAPTAPVQFWDTGTQIEIVSGSYSR